MNETTATEQEPVEIVINDTGEAIDMLYNCKAKIEVFCQLFNLKRNEDENNDYTFYDGVKLLNEDLYDYVGKVIELLDFVEGKAKLCKTDEEKIEDKRKKCKKFRRIHKKLKKEWRRMEKNMAPFYEEMATESTDLETGSAEREV